MLRHLVELTTNAGNPLEPLSTTCPRKGGQGTRLIAVPNGKKERGLGNPQGSP